LGVPPATVSKHLYVVTLAYPSAEASLVTHVGKEAFIAAIGLKPNSCQSSIYEQ